jgi:hypothetical protein
VAELANSALIRRAAMKAAVGGRLQTAAASPARDAFVSLQAVDATAWQALAARAIEPNGYYLPGWELAVNAFARGRTDASALAAWSDSSAPDGAAPLIGLMPAISLWRAYRIPLPALVSAHPYGTLCTPLLDRDQADAAATSLMQAARNAGAHALVLRDVALDGAAMKALTEVLRQEGL